MIKVKIYLDGDDFGVLDYTCNGTIQQFTECMNNNAELISLTVKDTNAIVSIPVTKYVVEVLEVDQNK